MSAMTDRLALPVIAVLSLVIVGAVAALLLGGHPAGPAAPRVAALPALNAALNTSSALLLTAGYVFIRRRRIAAHRACMLAAATVSTAFLVSYVIYHSLAGSRPFAGQGWMRTVYFPILITHVILAAAMVPFVLTTLYRALIGDFARHARVARWTLPVWLYVSVSGVAVYWMLYRW
jgi:putative membrane protein